ncbi:MAG: hypothetical protein AVDCRST_MAG28-2371 [uncultured Rubrobacteraceae bacterium]|uniref:Uncharacterized protein n=1 Tax=uncultured Rubrobacteraceae bacterium TaxID=349277 RepID=A0A6J4QXU2_9ACTN|nr:MAG: hypothetical protein AVDCRST_MAG28-2371 [uncultured Rubrobacteraceae bacterium]
MIGLISGIEVREEDFLRGAKAPLCRGRADHLRSIPLL